jgi:hypothetical protein
MVRTITLLIGYFDTIRDEAKELWDKGSGEGGGLSMNDGVTVCINVLRGIFHHLQTKKHMLLSDLENQELVEAVQPMARQVGKFFAALPADQVSQFRALRGVQGQTAGTRRIEKELQRTDPSFDPPGLKEFINREKAQTTTQAFEEIQAIGGPDGRGVGFYFRNVTEVILFGVRGKNARTLDAGRRQVNFLATRKQEHSRKPNEQYDIIEACSPGPYLELFARGTRPGWTSWGAEATDGYRPKWKTYARNSASVAELIS